MIKSIRDIFLCVPDKSSNIALKVLKLKECIGIIKSTVLILDVGCLWWKSTLICCGQLGLSCCVPASEVTLRACSIYL